jgi:hypothetical protein
MSTLPDKFDLLTLADAAELLHCSKAHVCTAFLGACRLVVIRYLHQNLALWFGRQWHGRPRCSSDN